MNYIGVDLGTSSVKALLLSDTLDVIFTKSETYPIYLGKNGESEQNPDEWLEKTVKVLKEIISLSEEKIGAISFSGQMHGLVCLDADDNVLRNALLWNDQRTGKQCDYLNNDIGLKNLINYTGNMALTGFTAPKVLWVRENEPEIFEKINKIMLPKDYIAYKLSGIFATDVSDASGTLYFDVKNRCWSDEMIDILGIKKEMLPEVFESYEVIGNLTDNMKNILGVDYDIKIVIGGGDQAVGAVGTCTVNDEDINLSLGTSGVVFKASSKFLYDENASVHSFCDATGKYHTMGVTLSAGGSMAWWYDKILEKSDYSNIISELEKTNANENLFFLPYLSGERSPINDSDIRGIFTGMALHHTQYDMTRAVIEGVTFSLRQVYDNMNNENVGTIKVTGGGAKNEIWLQIIADIFDTKIATIKSEEGPAFGASLLAMSGDTGIAIESLCEKSLQITAIIEPSSNSEVYKEKYKKWLEVYPKNK